MQPLEFPFSLLCLSALFPFTCTAIGYAVDDHPAPGHGACSYPGSGQIRSYTFNVSKASYAPDGVQKPGLLVNGRFPGPALDANCGDTLQITVHNNLDEGTSFHWHGLFQHGTQWYDGVPGVDLCPIAPGASFTYRFLADQPGTTWWHAHYDAQLADGLFGPIRINGSRYGIKYDVELPIVTLGSHYHKTYQELVKNTESTPPDIPLIDNNLINGKSYYNCSTVITGQSCSPNQSLSTLDFTTNKAHLLRLVNVGAEGTQHFAIDGHKMTVVANDFVPVQPYQVDSVTLATGQRTDIIVQGLANAAGAYFARSNISGVCDPVDRKSTRLNSSHSGESRMPSSA